MKISNTAKRLEELIDSRNIKQIDILRLCEPYCQEYGVKMNKSDISQYVAGKSEPNQDKLFILAKALNVNVSWLMGFDVPMENVPVSTIVTRSKAILDSFVPPDSDPRLLDYYNRLNDIGRKEAIKRVEELTYINKYIEIMSEQLADEREIFVNAAHAIEGASEEDIQHDEDIMNDDDF